MYGVAAENGSNDAQHQQSKQQQTRQNEENRRINGGDASGEHQLNGISIVAIKNAN